MGVMLDTLPLVFKLKCGRLITFGCGAREMITKFVEKLLLSKNILVTFVTKSYSKKIFTIY